ncbi:MAG: hypothetical protein WEE64_14850 [Dehalococcoidia bacterium]
MAVLRSVLLFSPFLAITLIILALIVQDVGREGASAGSIVGLVIVGFVTLLLGYQVIQGLRDLLSQTKETVGLVERRWSRSEFLFFQNTYIFVERNVFRIEPEHALDIESGSVVRITHLPHTGTVESVEVVQREELKAEA